MRAIGSNRVIVEALEQREPFSAAPAAAGQDGRLDQNEAKIRAHGRPY